MFLNKFNTSTGFNSWIKDDGPMVCDISLLFFDAAKSSSSAFVTNGSVFFFPRSGSCAIFIIPVPFFTAPFMASQCGHFVFFFAFLRT